MTSAESHVPAEANLSWHQIFDALDEPVLVIDRRECVVDVNQAALREIQCTADRARGLSLAELQEEPWPGCRALARLVRARGGERERDLREPRTGRHWSIRCRFLDGEPPAKARRESSQGASCPEDRLQLLVLRETTEFHLLRDAMRRYEKSTWLAEVVGGLAHQVNNPLFAISSTVEWLLLAPANDDAKAEMLAALQREVARLSGLMRSFVEFGTISCRHRGRHELAALVRESCSACGLLHSGSGLRVELEVEPGVMALVDREAIVLALSKVLENSRDLSPENGTIWITGHRTPPGNGMGESAPKVFELRIRDHGPGIPAAFRRRVFEPFFHLRSGHHGLGLALAERIFVAHGGTMECEECRQGASLVLRLPVAAQRSDQEESI